MNHRAKRAPLRCRLGFHPHPLCWNAFQGYYHCNDCLRRVYV